MWHASSYSGDTFVNCYFTGYFAILYVHLYVFKYCFKQEDVSVQLEALDILSDLLCRFGSKFDFWFCR